MSENTVPALRVEWPWNPNHKYRVYASRPTGDCRWLLTVRFSNKDQSLYLAPHYNGPVAIQAAKSGKLAQGESAPGVDLHLSLHESGIVNLTTNMGRTCLHEDLHPEANVRHVATLQFNSVDAFPEATLEDINTPRGGHLHIPLMAVAFAPIMLTIVCAKESANWNSPGLGNTMMMHIKTKMNGKDYNFHFVQWQDVRMPKGDGDIGMKFGGEIADLYS
jgi:hypothetical protein